MQVSPQDVFLVKSFIELQHTILTLRTCINRVWCPVLRAEYSSMPGLVTLKTRLLFQPVAWNCCTPPLSVVKFRWYCFTFSWKGICVVVTHTSHIVCCRMRVHAIPIQWFTFSKEFLEFLFHIHFKAPILAAKITMLNIFPTQSLCKRDRNNFRTYKKKFLLVSFCRCVLACLEICSNSLQSFGLDSPQLIISQGNSFSQNV